MVERARDVSIGSLGPTLEALAPRAVPAWDGRRHFSGEPRRTAAYLLVVDTTNFCFWGGEGGYWQLAEAIRDAFLAGEPLWDASRLAGLERSQLERHLGGMTLLDERLAALRELGAVARDRFGGELTRLIGATAVETARTLAARLSSFADFAAYDGRRVPLLKRAQIAAADLHAAGAARFPDVGELTCFADYKLPQVLRHLGALRYSDGLAHRVDGWQELLPGEPAEVEIRAATVVAVERLRDSLAEGGRSLMAVEVDWMLWALSQEIFPMRPHHRVRTIFY